MGSWLGLAWCGLQQGCGELEPGPAASLTGAGTEDPGTDVGVWAWAGGGAPVGLKWGSEPVHGAGSPDWGLGKGQCQG